MKKYITLLIVFAIIEISLALSLTFWRENFWNAVSNKEQMHFLQQLGIFILIALGACFVSGFSGYLINLTTIKWREVLNEKAFAIRESQTTIENLNQRIQEDTWQFPDLCLNLVFSTFKSFIYILVFSIALLFSFDWWYLFVFLGYTIIGSVMAYYIARPLIKLNYEQQRAEATYRNNLSIENFSDCLRLMLGLAKRQKKLTYFQQFYAQIAVVLPLIVIAPVYFTTGMTLGTLMRFNSVGSTLLENMSYTITSFAQINKLISCYKRLKEARIL